MTAERQTQSIRAMKATFCAFWIVLYAVWIIMEAHTVMTTTTHLAISGPFDLPEIALMGFGHRDERAPGAKPSNHAAHPHVATVRRQFELSGSPTVCVPSPSSVLN